MVSCMIKAKEDDLPLPTQKPWSNAPSTPN